MKHLTGVLFLSIVYLLYLSWNYFWMYLGWQGVAGVVVLVIIWVITRLKPHKL